MTSYQGNGNNNNQYHPNPNISIIMATSKGPSIPPSVPHQPLAAPTVNPTASIAQTGMAYPQTTSKPSAHAAYPQIQIQQQTQQQQQQYLQYQQLLQQQQQQQQYLPPQFKTQPQVKGAPAGYASQTIPQQVPELEWFRNLTGVTEEEFRAKGVYNFITTNPERSDELLLRNSVTGTLYECGSFRLTNESELRRRISTLSISQAPCGPCEFIIVTAESGASTDTVDVSMLQADPENVGSTFQVASNFNGVEGISEEIFPDNPNFATNYVYDMTQGPSASISAGPSAITRIYAAFCAKDVDPSMWAQTARRQVRMLDAFPYVSVLNGYAVLDDLAKQNTPASIDDVTGLVSVGLQTNTQVTYGKRAEGYFRCTPSNIKVNQVFCAALNMKQGEAGAMSRAHKNAAFVSKALLRAAYHCTFLAAIANKSQKLFLTMLGCGAFGNEPTEVFEEIADSFKSIAEDPNVNRGGVLKKVYLVLYRKTAIINTFVETLKQKRINYKVFVNGIQVPL